MRSLKFIGLGFWLIAAFAISLGAESFQLSDGRTITGELLLSSANDTGMQVKVGDGQYEKISWGDLSQATLKELSQNPKLLPHVEPFIEVPQEERTKKTEVTLKEVPRLARPAKGSLFGALFGSSVGLFCLLAIYAANIYAGHEIATVRAYPPALVCGVSAVAPFIGPAIFLFLPTRMQSGAEATAVEAPVEDIPVVNPMAGDVDPAAQPSGLHFAEQPHAASPSLPQTQVFQRGQFTFNRRFIETKFSGFFSVVRREAEKDMIVLLKTARGEFAATRISRISANDMHVEVKHGHASQEVAIPFGEIQEIQLKHKDA